MNKFSKNHNYINNPQDETFTCKVCGKKVSLSEMGSRYRNHCPDCLSSVHLDIIPGDRKSTCKGIMEPVGVWVRKGGEWAIIHRCKECGALSSNRIASDDNPLKLMTIALKPLSELPFPIDYFERLVFDHYRQNETDKPEE